MRCIDPQPLNAEGAEKRRGPQRNTLLIVDRRILSSFCLVLAAFQIEACGKRADIPSDIDKWVQTQSEPEQPILEVSLEGHDEFVLYGWSPKGRYFLWGYEDESAAKAHVFSVEEKTDRTIPLDGWIDLLSTVWSQDEKRLLVGTLSTTDRRSSSHPSDRLTERDARTLEVIRTIYRENLGAYVNKAEYFPDGDSLLIVTVSENFIITRQNFTQFSRIKRETIIYTSEKELTRLSRLGWLSQGDWSPDGKAVYHKEIEFRDLAFTWMENVFEDPSFDKLIRTPIDESEPEVLIDTLPDDFAGFAVYGGDVEEVRYERVHTDDNGNPSEWSLWRWTNDGKSPREVLGLLKLFDQVADGDILWPSISFSTTDRHTFIVGLEFGIGRQYYRVVLLPEPTLTTLDAPDGIAYWVHGDFGTLGAGVEDGRRLTIATYS